jgi:excisionase family DNA binding protein
VVEIDKLIYSVTEVSELTGWSRERVRALIKRGQIKAVNTNPPGGKPKWSILGAELKRFLGVDQVKQPRELKRRRVDAGCENIFGA